MAVDMDDKGNLEAVLEALHSVDEDEADEFSAYIAYASLHTDDVGDAIEVARGALENGRSGVGGGA